MQMKNVEDVYPLSPMQEGMLFHSLYAPQSEVYFEQVTCIIHGNLDTRMFKQAWQQVVARHPVLRTLFLWEGLEEHLQVVRQRVPLPWSEYDWQSLTDQERQARLQSWLQADRAQSFQISRAPLLRLCLIRLSEDVYHFTWSFHHLLLDGWSTSMVLGEAFAFYEAAHKGRAFSPPPCRPYRDYIAWLQQQDLSRAEAFWRQTLQDFTSSTPLGVDRASWRKEEQAADYHTQLFHISASTTAELQRLARQQQLTFNTLVQGAWGLLLARYSGQQDVVFGTTVSGRPSGLTGVETMVGLFINTLPQRVQVTPQQRVLPWLHRLQEQQAEARQYDYSPLVQVQGWSEAPRGQPLFESLLVFENFPVDTSLEQKGSLEIEQGLAVERTNYPLTITVIPETSMLIRIGYTSSRFDAETIKRIAQHFQVVLESLLTQPQQRLSELQILTVRERQQLLEEWNTPSSFANPACLHQIFEAQVALRPDAVAVVFEEQQITCEALNRRANQLGHALRKMGVGPETLVGLCLERSLDLVVGLMGILKAGGAYVPLDPSYPLERLAFMLQDAAVRVLVTEQRLHERLPASEAALLSLDGDRERLALEPTSNLEVPQHPDNLAYVIYTSGSTGRPKGVQVTHQNVARLFASTQARFRFSERDCWTLFHSAAFDFSVWELWGALLYGGRLVVVPFWQSRSPESFWDLLYRQQVTVLNQTTSAFQQLLGGTAGAWEEQGETLRVRLIIFGGEALDLPSVQRWWERYGEQRTQLVNMYGITETTVHVTAVTLRRAEEQADGQSPIGRPLEDLQVYVLDVQGQPVPIGVSGELYVGGAGVARGYLRRPELTAQRFVPHPFSQESGARLYRTGDMGRYRADGHLEYLGRNDSQVKIRGFRIELGEIETALRQHPAVHAALVIVHEELEGNRRLIAYIVTDQEQLATNGELRRYLQQRLPDYMLPSAFVAQEAFPLTSHGKVDRKALPQPDQVRPERKNGYTAPRTPIEESLVAIWAQVLHQEQVGIHDNFFDLGGNSFLATRIIMRIRQEFQVELPLRTLFLASTVAALAEQIGSAQREKQGARMPAIKRLTRSPRSSAKR